MKRLLLIIPFLLLFSSVDAQLFKVFGHDVGFIYVGPRVGMNFSKFSNFNGAFEDNKFGYQFGAVGEFGFTSKFSIQTELMFFNKGSKDNDFGKVKMNYLGIPILAKYAFKAFGLSKVYAMGGTFANVRVGGEFVYDNGQTFPLGEDLKKTEWGLGLGAGAEYPMKSGIVGLDLKYYLGITDIHDNDDSKTRSRSLEVVLTYKFDLVDLFFKMKKKSNSNDTETVEGENKIKGLKVEERN